MTTEIYCAIFDAILFGVATGRITKPSEIAEDLCKAYHIISKDEERWLHDEDKDEEGDSHKFFDLESVKKLNDFLEQLEKIDALK